MHLLEDAPSRVDRGLRIAPRIGAAIADERGHGCCLRQCQLRRRAAEVAARSGLDTAPLEAEIGALGERVEQLGACPRARHPGSGCKLADALAESARIGLR